MKNNMDDATTDASQFEQERKNLAQQRARRQTVDRTLAAVVPLVFWQLAAEYFGKKWISSPYDVGMRIWSMTLDGSLAMHSWETFREAMLGLLIGVILGIIFGIMLGMWRRLADAVDPVVMGLYSLPRVSLAPLFIIWLGIGLLAKVTLVASMVVFVVLFSVREGVRNIDREIIESFRSMNASKIAMIRHVITPSLMPWLMTSIRIGIGMSLVGAVVGEMIGSSRGLGWYVNHSSGVYDMTGAITALFVLMLMAMAFNGLLALIERRVLHWRSSSDSWMLK
jgi:NitT/TauT family transport system permease protein